MSLPRRALLASVILHSPLVFFWWKPFVARPPKEMIEVEFPKTPAPAPAPKTVSKSTSDSASATGPSRLSLKKFGASTLNSALAGGGKGAGKNLTDEGELGLLESDWGSHGGRLSEIEYFNKYEKIFAHLHGMVAYPGILGLHAMSDSVNSRLVFDENSHCDWKRSRVGGANPYFRVYALSILRRLCDLETIEHIKFKRSQFVDLNFTFAIIGLPEEKPTPDGILGNVLSFRRTFLRPPFEYHVGPFTGIFGIPAVSLDFPWIFEHWEKWVEGKDPLREFRPPAD